MLAKGFLNLLQAAKRIPHHRLEEKSDLIIYNSYYLYAFICRILRYKKTAPPLSQLINPIPIPKSASDFQVVYFNI